MNFDRSSIVMVVIAIIVVVGTLASQRPRMGEPFRKRPAAIVLAVVVLLIAAMCVYLATRHGV